MYTIELIACRISTQNYLNIIKLYSNLKRFIFFSFTLAINRDKIVRVFNIAQFELLPGIYALLVLRSLGEAKAEELSVSVAV